MTIQNQVNKLILSTQVHNIKIKLINLAYLIKKTVLKVQILQYESFKWNIVKAGTQAQDESTLHFRKILDHLTKINKYFVYQIYYNIFNYDCYVAFDNLTLNSSKYKSKMFNVVFSNN